MMDANRIEENIKKKQEEHDRIWNAAIDTVARYLEKDGWRSVPNIIRELKK